MTRALIMAVLIATLPIAAWMLDYEGYELLPPQSASAEASREDDGAMSRHINRRPLPDALKQPRIEIHKAQRKLELYDGDELLRRWRIGLGFNPVGDKQFEGDGRTPEGKFAICVKNDKSKYYLSLGLNYPTIEDATRGLAQQVIDQATHDEIVQAAMSGQTPPWDTALGGEIFIHGEGGSRDWTAGCIALDNPQMKVLFDLVPLGTPVVVYP